MFSAMLTDAFQDVDAGFPIRYRFDGKLLNLRRLQAKSKVQTDVVDKLLYADDLAENAKSEEKMQGAVDRMSKACDNFQLTISKKKTVVVHQQAPGKPYSKPTITVNGQKLQVVDKFTYLGSTLSFRIPSYTTAVTVFMQMVTQSVSCHQDHSGQKPSSSILLSILTYHQHNHSQPAEVKISEVYATFLPHSTKIIYLWSHNKGDNLTN